MKQCTTCKKHKGRSEFYKDSRRRDGLKSQCKQCHCKTTIESRDPDKARSANREYMRRARNLNPDKFRARERSASIGRSSSLKAKARAKLNYAVKSGAISRPSECSACGRLCKPEAHHDDYSKPLDVEWLCSLCHGKVHRISSDTAVVTFSPITKHESETRDV